MLRRTDKRRTPNSGAGYRSAGLRMVARDTQARTPDGSAGLRLVAPDTRARTPDGCAGLRLVAADTRARTPDGCAGLCHRTRNARLRELDRHPDHSGRWGVQVAPPNSPASRAQRLSQRFQYIFSPWMPPSLSREKKYIGISESGVARATPGKWGVQLAPPDSLNGLASILGNGPRRLRWAHPRTQRPVLQK